MTKKLISLTVAFILILVFCQTTVLGQGTYDTTITIADPSSGTQTLSFPRMGFDIDYKAQIAGVCPDAIVEGTLVTSEGSSAIVTPLVDSSGLYLTLNTCTNSPILIPNVDGRMFEIKNGADTYSLTVSEPSANSILFEFESPALAVHRLSPLQLTPGKNPRFYNSLGRPISHTDLVYHQKLFSK